ncbi:MAG: glycoside hydrolase family 32 protein [Planctomycetota bacterium]|jgi:sucrose-6-phosphate hydrolase SacC (GH32 family)
MKCTNNQYIGFKLGLFAFVLAGAILLTGQAFAEENVFEGVSRELVLDEKYIIFPVADETHEDESEVQLLTLEVDGEKVREFFIRLAPGEPAYWFFTETQEFRGKTATLRASRITDKELDSFFAIRVDKTYPGADEVYTEKLRPQLHFSSKRGWNNDANGMMYYKGEYHLFYQHNPFSSLGGNMSWGHAVSKDLLHWEELGDAIHPDQYGTIFSGSGVVDWNNTTGFQTGDEAPLITIFTYSGDCDAGPWSAGQPFTQAIAYSNDRGRTWTKYEGNPVQGRVKGNNRDPKVIWWEETQEWVIVLWLDTGEMAFFRSPDLKRWELQSIFKSGSLNECAELFQLAVDGDEDNKKWIFYGGSGDYFIGDFDGSHYTPEGKEIRYSYGNCFYASQIFNNVPKEDGRRIQIGWGLNRAPGMPFNQMMTFPVSLTLHTTEDGLRMFANPVKEIEKLYVKEHEWSDKAIPADESVPAPGVEGELFDIDAVLSVGEAEELGLIIRGQEIIYNVKEKKLVFGEQSAPLKTEDGSIRLRCIVDRTSIEIFANGGRIYMPCKFRPEDDEKTIAAFARGGAAEIKSLKLRELESIWR